MKIGGENGRLIAQSGTINRYLASLVKTPGFVPTDPVEKAYCDMIHEAAEELFMIMPCVNIYKGDKFQQEKETTSTTPFQPDLKILQSFFPTIGGSVEVLSLMLTLMSTFSLTLLALLSLRCLRTSQVSHNGCPGWRIYLGLRNILQEDHSLLILESTLTWSQEIKFYCV
eukprot:TRINITY_DN22388_c0_g1_i1.p1 TRINITY_DN22388_c0_g1~~TRINITY_DN22388_c0_g1_i1.p1  ORF type:complete len:170 (+),score=21.85 TRINITY_DN22388_c0_g1_i1:246-755(+)